MASGDDGSGPICRPITRRIPLGAFADRLISRLTSAVAVIVGGYGDRIFKPAHCCDKADSLLGKRAGSVKQTK
jgi:hypothetical protein